MVQRHSRYSLSMQTRSRLLEQDYPRGRVCQYQSFHRYVWDNEPLDRCPDPLPSYTYGLGLTHDKCSENHSDRYFFIGFIVSFSVSI